MPLTAKSLVTKRGSFYVRVWPESGIFLSTNNGGGWSQVDSLMEVNTLATTGINVFAGTNGDGVLLSTNNGTTWTQVNTGLSSDTVIAFAVSGMNLFAATDRNGVFLTTNNGTSWTAVNSGLTNTIVRSFAVSGAYLFVGTEGGGVWRRPLSEMITDVESISEFPQHFSLEQNYPNPFNPSTTISYQFPTQSHVTLKVYDVLGHEVATLLNEEKPAGAYTVRWDANGVASGVYFYRMSAGSFVDVKKLVLLK